VLGEQGRYPEQSRVLEEAMLRDPLNELLLVNYTGNLSVRGEWERGRDMMAELLELKPDSTILLRFMAKMELYNGNLVEGWKLAHRAYELQPDNPEDIASLARTWVLLGDVDEAERLLLEGMAASPNNANLRNSYWMVLMVSKRFEEAEQLVRELKAGFGDDLPEALQRRFDFQLGLLAMIQQEFPAAREYLVAALSEDDNPAWSGDEIMTLTLASLALERTGEGEQASDLLEEARRMIRRARLNGVDDPNIYYSEGVLLSMQDDPDGALQKLQEAYDKGFREYWVFEVDGRLDPLRDHPDFLLLKDRVADDVTRALAEIRSLALAMM
jgi:Flp pilus assembly protein TadD